MATIKDVAKLANVSVATVSRVINSDPKVKAETKEIVQVAIRELNYAPNLLGRNLRRSYTKNILVLLPTISNQFYSAIIKGIRQEAYKEGYNVMLGITDLDSKIEMQHIKLLETKLVDGIIFFAPQIDAKTISSVERMYPVVQCSEYIQGVDISGVSIDNKQAAYDATKYLISLGHTKIAMITSKKKYTSSTLREQGFKAALKDSRISIPKGYIYRTDYSPTSGTKACYDLLEQKEAPTAIFTISDSQAIGVMRGIQELGKIAGKDIDVIGFDNTFVSKVYHPTITTISQPRFEMGEKAAALLLRKIKDIQVPNTFILLPHELIIRESTKKLK